MFRMLQIALCSALMLAAACKKGESPVPGTVELPADPTKSAVPAKPADPSVPTPAVVPPNDPTKPPPPPSAAGTPGNTELENRGVAMMLQLAGTFEADAKDCEKLATDIRAFIAQNKPLLSQLTAMEKKQSQQDREAFAQRNKGVEQEVMKKMTPAMTSCRDNKSVEAAMQQFPTE